MSTPIVVLESLEAPLRRKWIEFLIENDHIAFEPSQSKVGSPRKSYYSARIRLIRPAIMETTTGDQRRIARALQSLSEREKEGKSIPPYAKFCALLSSSMDDSTNDYASRTPSKQRPDRKNSEATSADGGDGNPRKRSIEWVSRRIDQIFAAKEASLKEEEQEHGTVSSATNHIFPVFVYDYLMKTFGLTNLVNRNSMDLVFSLHHQREQSDYLALFARFLDEEYDEDDLLFYFHARDAVLRHKQGGMDFPFTRKEEILSFSSIAHAGADFLKKAFNDQTVDLTLPCDAHTVLLLAVENYHNVRTGSTPTVPSTDMTPATPAERVASSTVTPASRRRASARTAATSTSESRSRLSSIKLLSGPASSVKPTRKNQTAVPKPGTVAHQRVKQQSLEFDDEDDRTLDEIYHVQERIKEQLEAALSSSSGVGLGGNESHSGGRRSGKTGNQRSPSGFQYVSPSRWREEFPATTDEDESDDQYGGTRSSSLKEQGNGFTQRRVLPLIQTTRSPEDSSASSASPRSFASPSHQQVQAIASSNTSPAANRRGFFSSASPMHQKYSSPGGSGPATTRIGAQQSSFFESTTSLVDTQTSTKSMMSEVNIEEVQQQLQDQLHIAKEDESSRAESASSSSYPPPPQPTTTNDEEEEEFASALMTPSGARDEKEELSATNTPSSTKHEGNKAGEVEKREGEGPIVALQRAIAKSGSAYLDKFMASLSSSVSSTDAPSPSSPSSMSTRFAIRKEAMNVLSKKTSRVVDQIVASTHSHVPEDCSHTYCPYTDLRAAFTRIVKMSQSKKNFTDDVQDLARRIVDSAMIRREMEALKNEKLASSTATTSSAVSGTVISTPIKSTIPKQ